MLSERQVIAILQRESEQYGMVRTAQTYAIDPGQLSQVLSGKRPVTKRIATQMGYEVVPMYRSLR